MKILLVCTPCLPCRKDLEYGGIERVVAILAEGLAKKHDVTLIAGEGSKVKGVNLITPVESRYSLPGENREKEMWVKAGIEANGYDVIDWHTHLPPVVRKWNVIWSIHDLLPPNPIFPFTLVARSKFHAKWLNKIWLYTVMYAYNCVIANEFRFKKEKKDYFLFLSRMSKGKGIFNFVEIAKQMPEQYFVMAGEDRLSYGIDINELLSLYKQLPDNIDYIGFVNNKEKKKLLSNARALVLPYDSSYQEVFGLIILEAMASGTPVFAIKNGAVPELLNGVGLTRYGYVAENVKELVNALKYFTSGKFEFNAIALLNRAKKFSPEAMVKRYEEIYKEGK